MKVRSSTIALLICFLTGLHCQSGQSDSSTVVDDPAPQSNPAVAQYDTSRVVPPPLPRKSPIVIARTTVGSAYLKVVYGSPSKRGRVVFGALEPFGEVWRVGANETTELTTTKAIRFGDISLGAGTYSVFAIPEPNRWTFILNEGLGQWGAYDYDESLDVGRFSIPTQRTEKVFEALTIWFEEAGSDLANFRLAWDETQISIPIRLQ